MELVNNLYFLGLMLLLILEYLNIIVVDDGLGKILLGLLVELLVVFLGFFKWIVFKYEFQDLVIYLFKDIDRIIIRGYCKQ